MNVRVSRKGFGLESSFLHFLSPQLQLLLFPRLNKLIISLKCRASSMLDKKKNSGSQNSSCSTCWSCLVFEELLQSLPLSTYFLDNSLWRALSELYQYLKSHKLSTLLIHRFTAKAPPPLLAQPVDHLKLALFVTLSLDVVKVRNDAGR